MSADGLLFVLKPPGMSSHDVVGFARRRLRERRIGHLGTLDPGAAGALVLACGKATALARYGLEAAKRYRAEAELGVATDTQDAFGTPGPIRHGAVRLGELRAALQAMVG
ncbi:MAG TPA: pseudouridine synthase, partial [Limnochordia bacterium]|nr:pseudouridine synthase [Limnochordia bacterium]